MKRKQKQAVSHEEVQNALRKFKAEGGLITQLPDQVAPSNKLVGGRWAMYEPVSLSDSGSDLKVV